MDADTSWVVIVNDVAPDGSSRLMTKGWLRASHRAIDETRSKPWQPYHPHIVSIPVDPGKVHEYAIEIRESSNVFKARHRIELVIRGQDSSSEDPIWFHLCNIKETRHTLYHSEEHASYLLVPVIPGT